MLVSKKIWIVWLTVSLFYAYQYILRVLPSVFLVDISNKFGLSPDVFGQFSGVYYIGYSLMHIPIGAMLDRYGPKRVLPVFILLTVLGTLSLVFANHWYYPIIGRALVGIGSSAAILGVFKIVRSFFESSKFSRMLSFSVTIGLIGAIYGGGPVQIMRTQFGYETVVFILAAVGTVLALVTYFLIPEISTQDKKVFSLRSVVQDIQSILSNRVVITLCLIAGLMVGPLEGFADVWGVQFLKLVYRLDDGLAASLPSFIFIGMCFGGPLLSFIGEYTKKYLHVILFSALAMGVGFALLVAGILTPGIMSVLFVIIGICCAYQILAIDQVSKQVESRKTGMATALANMIIMIFGYVFHGAIGKIVAASMAPGQVDLTQAAIINGVSLIPITLFASVMGMIFVIRMKKKERKA